MESNFQTPQATIKEFQVLEEELISDLGIDGLKFLKKLRLENGSMEKYIDEMKAEREEYPDIQDKRDQVLTTIEKWAALQKDLDSNRSQDQSSNGDKITSPRSSDTNGCSNKVKLQQSWADRMEAMQESTSGIKSAAATSNKVHEYREGSSSTHNGTIQFTKDQELLGSEAVLVCAIGEEDRRHGDNSKMHVGELQVQVKGAEYFTLNGNAWKEGTAANTLNGLVSQGLVVSGTPDGVLAVHGSPSCDHGSDSNTQPHVAPSGSMEANKDEAAVNMPTMENEARTGMHSVQSKSTKALDHHMPNVQSVQSMLASLGSDKFNKGPQQLFGREVRGDQICSKGSGFSRCAGPSTSKQAGAVEGTTQNWGGSIQFGTMPAAAKVTQPFGSARSSKWIDVLGKGAVGQTKLTYIPPTFRNGRAEVHVTTEQFSHLEEKNKNLLVGSAIGKRPDFAYVKAIVTKAWKHQNFEMKSYGEHSFSFEFRHEEDKRAALEVGSFHIASQLFIVQSWKPFIEMDLHQLKTIPIWVMFHKFPPELWNSLGFSQVASAIGRPMYPDKLTESKDPSSYARICVEIDSDCVLPGKVPVLIGESEVNIEVEYKWKPPLCSSCNIFGHTLAKCPRSGIKNRKNQVWKPIQQNAEPTSEIAEPTRDRNMHKEQTKEKEDRPRQQLNGHEDTQWERPAKKHTFKARRVQDSTSMVKATTQFSCLIPNSNEEIASTTEVASRFEQADLDRPPEGIGA